MSAQPVARPDQAVRESARTTCVRMFDAIVHGDLSDFEAVVHRDAVNREARTEATRQRGPSGFRATALWLRTALADMRWEINDVVTDGDLTVAHTIAHGRHVGPFVFYDNDGRVEQVFPPTGRTCSVTQTHWFRIREGQVIEHWANRDDMGTARQLGWIPPSPRYLARMALAKRRALRSLS